MDRRFGNGWRVAEYDRIAVRQVLTMLRGSNTATVTGDNSVALAGDSNGGTNSNSNTATVTGDNSVVGPRRHGGGVAAHDTAANNRIVAIKLLPPHLFSESTVRKGVGR
jgi:hypothetical protein